MLLAERSLPDGIDRVLNRGYAPRTLSKIPSQMLSKVKLVRAKELALLLLGGVLGSAILATARPGRAPSEKKAARADAAAGKKLFERHCAACHGIEGKGGRGPALNRAKLPHAPDDTALQAVIAGGIPPNMPEGWFLTDDDVANLAAFVRSLSKIPSDPVPGDPARGAAVYARSGCSGCHIRDGAGTGYGPDLTAIGDRRSPAFLLKAVSKPASVLPEDFLLVRVTTASGETLEGIRANEDSFTIQIKDPSGRYHSWRKEELKELNKRRGESPMPSFEGMLSVADLQDLVAFLASQRGKQ
jgi:cytochrome c oxidase cbb3-type subunit III